MLGIVLLLVIIAIAAAFVVQKQFTIPCQVQDRWWRVTPPGVKPLATGRAMSLFAVIRAGHAAGAKSFNYSYKTGNYQLFADWLVNWTQPIDILPQTGPNGERFTPTEKVEHCTGTLATGTPPMVAPAPCCRKIRCEMEAHGMMTHGKSQRDWNSQEDMNYYDTSAARKSWPDNDGTPQPPANLTTAMKQPYLDTETMDKVKKSGQAIGMIGPDGKPAPVPPPDDCTEANCDFCQSFDANGNCANSTAKFWYGCNAMGQLYADAAQTKVYDLSSAL